MHHSAMCPCAMSRPDHQHGVVPAATCYSDKIASRCRDPEELGELSGVLQIWTWKYMKIMKSEPHDDRNKKKKGLNFEMIYIYILYIYITYIYITYIFCIYIYYILHKQTNREKPADAGDSAKWVDDLHKQIDFLVWPTYKHDFDKHQGIPREHG